MIGSLKGQRLSDKLWPVYDPAIQKITSFEVDTPPSKQMTSLSSVHRRYAATEVSSTRLIYPVALLPRCSGQSLQPKLPDRTKKQKTQSMKILLSLFRLPAAGLCALVTAALLLAPFPFSKPAGAQTAPRVALVTRGNTAPGADQPYVNHLRDRGWKVTVVDDDRIRDNGPRAVSGYDLVVITPTVFWQRVKWRLRNAPEPIIVAKPELFPGFGMTTASRSNWGYTRSSKKVQIVNPGHEMAAGLSGEVIVAIKAKPMNFGRVGNSATVVASARDTRDQPVVFAYGRGETLANGERASGPRIGMYMSQTHAGFANRDGWALFDAAAAWAVPNAPGVDKSVKTFPPIARNNRILIGADVAKEQQSSGYAATFVAERQTGRKFDLINRNHEFSAGLKSDFFFDRKHIEDGRTLLMSWRATDNPNSTNGTRDPQRARKIVNGEFDEQIEAMATAMRDLEAPILMMFAWEMDQDAGQPQLIGTPQEFIAAWRYVHRIFEQRGATNVEWVFAPRARSFAKGEGQTFYPGSEYVDWIGGFAVPINTYEDPVTIYRSWYEWGINTGKPQLLWVGLREKPDDAAWKPGFIDQIRSLATSNWTGLKAIVYYSNLSPLGFDYTIDTTNRSLQAFRRLACDPIYTAGC